MNISEAYIDMSVLFDDAITAARLCADGRPWRILARIGEALDGGKSGAVPAACLAALTGRKGAPRYGIED